MAYICKKACKEKAREASKSEQNKGECWTPAYAASNVGRTNWCVQHTELSLGRESRPKGVKQIVKLHGDTLLCMQDYRGQKANRFVAWSGDST